MTSWSIGSGSYLEWLIMNRDEALNLLSAHRGEIERRFGVKSLAVFGSVARDVVQHKIREVKEAVDRYLSD